MALEVFKCENCGARVPPPPTTVRMVVCEFCSNPGLNPFYVEPAPSAHAPQPAAHAPSPAAPQPAAHAPSPAAPQPAAHAPSPAAPPRPRTAEEIARLAQAQLKVFDSLFYAPAIPPKKEQGARASYGAMIPADDPILALYDSTVFGGADDGFVITSKRLGWKNIALDPHVVTWDAFDPHSVRATGEEIQVMGDVIQIPASSELQARLVQFLQAMAPAPAAQPAPQRAAQPAPQRAAPAAGAYGSSKSSPLQAAMKAPQAEEDQEEEGEEEYDAETVQSWIDDTTGFAEENFTRTASLHIAPNIPRDKVRLAFETYADEIGEDDTVVVLYDPAGGGADDGFIATPWGLFWKNRGEDPLVVWWEDVDIDDVVLEDGVLSIEDEVVRINSQDRRLADELYAFIEAMVSWAQD